MAPDDSATWELDKAEAMDAAKLEAKWATLPLCDREWWELPDSDDPLPDSPEWLCSSPCVEPELERECSIDESADETECDICAISE